MAAALAPQAAKRPRYRRAPRPLVASSPHPEAKYQRINYTAAFGMGPCIAAKKGRSMSELLPHTPVALIIRKKTAELPGKGAPRCGPMVKSATNAAAARDLGRYFGRDFDDAVLGLAHAVLGRDGNVVLALGGGIDAVGGDTVGDKSGAHRLDPLLCELVIIGVGAAAVRKPDDLDAGRSILRDLGRRLLHCGGCFRTEFLAIPVEIGVIGSGRVEQHLKVTDC